MEAFGSCRTGEHRSDGKYKFLGGVLGCDGKVYFIPSDADRVLQVDPETLQCKEVGPSLRNEAYVTNKWQNGFSSPSGDIYAVPLKGACVLCIRPHVLTPEGEPTVTMVGGPFMGLNKWEGGVVGPDGACYCMPLNHRRVLRICPPGGPALPSTQGVGVGGDMATLRSSRHTAKFSKGRKSDPGPRGDPLPGGMTGEAVLRYEEAEHPLAKRVLEMLRLAALRGGGEGKSAVFEALGDALEDVKLAAGSLAKGSDAQDTLAGIVEADERFLKAFDDFVDSFILPHLKGVLSEAGRTREGDKVKFYVQRPPTLRIQPGPSPKYVRAHNDGEYGHQPGEVNFWMPLTDAARAMATLWVEVEPGFYQSMGSTKGEVVRFHGTSKKHYVPSNPTNSSRVSLDFRVGVQGSFDPDWTLKGEVGGHGRRQVEL